MPQHVPEMEWTEDALELRQFVFDYWGENKRAPTWPPCMPGPASSGAV